MRPVALFLLAVACSGARTAPPAPTTSQAPLADAAAPSAPPAAPCDVMLAAHRAVAARAAQAHGTPLGPPPEHLGACLPAPGGAWALVLDDSAETEGGRALRWMIRWRGDDGATAAAAPELPSPHCQEPATGCNLPAVGSVTFDAPRTIDLDGDGRMALYVGAEHRAEEGIYSASRAIYALRGGAVAAVELPLPAGARLAGVDDVDGDGRLDLLSHGPYTGDDTSSCAGFPTRVTGPLLLAHGLAGGGWSWTDEVARAFAARACPRAPTALANVQDVACARLWGWDAARARRAIRCRGRRPADSCDRPPAGVCGDFDVRAAWAAATPPLTLGPAAR